MPFRGGDGVRYPPPPSGGSKLNNSTCGVDFVFSAALVYYAFSVK